MKRPSLTYLGKVSGIRPLRSMITISGDSEVLIENCNSIIDHSEIKCALSAAGYLVEVWGEDLVLTSFSDGGAGVCGRIKSVTIERRQPAKGR